MIPKVPPPAPSVSARSVPRAALTAIVGKYLSPILTRSLVDRAFADASVVGQDVPADRLPKVKASLEEGLRTFVGDALRGAAIHEVRDFDGLGTPPAVVIRIAAEGDVQAASAAARSLCAELGGSALAAQRVATSVSELARNIFLYARGLGTIELVPSRKPRIALLVRAVDHGNGIGPLADVLAGKYQSKTGLGRGLAGVKRLSDKFDIASSANGTRVETEIWL